MTLLEPASQHKLAWQVVPLVEPIATVARVEGLPVAVVDFAPQSGYRAMLTDGTEIGTFQSLEGAQRAVERRLAGRAR